MSCEKKCSEKLRNIHRKIPVLESLFNNVASLKACNFIKKRLQHRCCPVNIAKFLRTPTLRNICERLLLTIESLVKLFVFDSTIVLLISTNNSGFSLICFRFSLTGGAGVVVGHPFDTIKVT